MTKKIIRSYTMKIAVLLIMAFCGYSQAYGGTSEKGEESRGMWEKTKDGTERAWYNTKSGTQKAALQIWRGTKKGTKVATSKVSGATRSVRRGISRVFHRGGIQEGSREYIEQVAKTKFPFEFRPGNIYFLLVEGDTMTTDLARESGLEGRYAYVEVIYNGYAYSTRKSGCERIPLDEWMDQAPQKGSRGSLIYCQGENLDIPAAIRWFAENRKDLDYDEIDYNSADFAVQFMRKCGAQRSLVQPVIVQDFENNSGIQEILKKNKREIPQRELMVFPDAFVSTGKLMWSGLIAPGGPKRVHDKYENSFMQATHQVMYGMYAK